MKKTSNPEPALIQKLRTLVETLGADTVSERLRTTDRTIRRWLSGAVELEGPAAVAVSMLAKELEPRGGANLTVDSPRPPIRLLPSEEKPPANPAVSASKSDAGILVAAEPPRSFMAKVRDVVLGDGLVTVVDRTGTRVRVTPERAARILMTVDGVEPDWESLGELRLIYSAVSERKRKEFDALVSAGALVGFSAQECLGPVSLKKRRPLVF